MPPIWAMDLQLVCNDLVFIFLFKSFCSRQHLCCLCVNYTGIYHCCQPLFAFLAK